MKKILFNAFAVWILCGMPLWMTASQQVSLEDLYNTGQVRLEQALVITEDNLPQGTLFLEPRGVAADQEGHIYVLDYRAHHIVKFDAEGQFLKILGREGEGPGEFTGPYRLTFAKDRLLVYELGDRRLNSIDPEGNYIDNVLMNIDEGSLRDICGLADGNVLVRRERTYLWYEDRPQDCMLFVFSPELKPLNKIYEHTILRNKYITEPERTNVPQPFFADVCWTTTPDGKVVIGYAETYEIELYDPEKGRLFSFSHTYKPVKVTKEDKDNWFGRLSYSRGGQIMQGAQDFVKKNSNFPSSKPPYHDIKVDPQGNILVFTQTQDKVSDFTYFDAFDAKGNFINRVEVVGENSFQKDMPRLGEFFGAITTNDDGLNEVSLFRISK